MLYIYARLYLIQALKTPLPCSAVGVDAGAIVVPKTNHSDGNRSVELEKYEVVLPAAERGEPGVKLVACVVVPVDEVIHGAWVVAVLSKDVQVRRVGVNLIHAVGICMRDLDG